VEAHAVRRDALERRVERLDAQKKRRAEIYVEATNAALKGIPAEMVRFHTCYGINEGPRLYEASLADVIGYMLKINAGSYSFECANPRHEHEYHLFERIKLPEGKVVCPGMITHASNIVEHPELIAERIMRFAFDLWSYDDVSEHAADMLVPELTRRGRYKEVYAEGTLREKLFGGGRARLSAPHPAVEYRQHHRAKAAE